MKSDDANEFIAHTFCGLTGIFHYYLQNGKQKKSQQTTYPHVETTCTIFEKS